MSTNLALTQAAYEGFGNGDMNPLFSILAEDILWNSHSHPSSPFHGVHRGVPAIQAYFGNMVKVELEKFEIMNMIEADDRVVVLVDVRRVTKESGQMIEGMAVHTYKFANGKITQADLYEPSAAL